MHASSRRALRLPRRSALAAAMVVVAFTCFGADAQGEDAHVRLNLTRLAKMDDNERSEIAKSKVRFEGFDPAERKRLQALETALQNDKDQADLRRVMIRYSEWLASLSEGQQIVLRRIDKPDDRIRRIREMMAADLPEVDRRVVGEWIHNYAKEQSKELLEIARENRLLPRPELVDAARQQVGSMKAAFIVWRAIEAGKESLLPFDELDFRVLASKLSPEPAERLNECLNVEMKKLVLANWMKNMARDFEKRMRMFGPRSDTATNYPILLQQLDPEEKYEIFSLSPDEARTRLAEEWSSRNDDFPFGGPGGFRPPPPDDRDGGRRGGRRGHDDDDDDDRRDRDHRRDRLDQKSAGDESDKK